MVDFVTDSSINLTGAYKGHRHKQRYYLHHLVFYYVVNANKSAYLGHTTNVIVVYQSLGLI